MGITVDVATGEPILQEPAGMMNSPAAPILPPPQLPARTTQIGLEKVRAIARARDEPFLASGARITAAEVIADQGGFFWYPSQIQLTIDPRGVCHCLLTTALDGQQPWLDRLDLRSEVFEQLFQTPPRKGHDPIFEEAVAFADWRPTVAELVEPTAAESEILNLIQSAQQRLLVSAYWLRSPRIAAALTQAQERGVSCTVYGRPYQLEAISRPWQTSPHVMASETTQVLVIADDSLALGTNRVCLQSPAGRQIKAFITARLKPPCAAKLQEHLLGRVAGD